jgi:hypothetical protein
MSMTVEEVMKALAKVADKSKPASILDKQGNFQAAIATVEEDSTDVFIVIEEWPAL